MHEDNDVVPQRNEDVSNNNWRILAMMDENDNLSPQGPVEKTRILHKDGRDEFETAVSRRNFWFWTGKEAMHRMPGVRERYRKCMKPGRLEGPLYCGPGYWCSDHQPPLPTPK